MKEIGRTPDGQFVMEMSVGEVDALYRLCESFKEDVSNLYYNPDYRFSTSIDMTTAIMAMMTFATELVHIKLIRDDFNKIISQLENKEKKEE